MSGAFRTWIARVHDREFRLARGGWTIGRGAENNIRLDDPYVSGFHASLTVDARGLRIRDEESRHGTLVNGERVDGDIWLNHGDVVRIGTQVLKFTLPAGSGRQVRGTPARGIRRVGERDGPGNTTAQHTVDSVLVAEVSELLAQGEIERAQQGLSRLFRLLGQDKADGPRDVTMLRLASGAAMRLADTMDSDVWIEKIVEAHHAAEVVMSVTTADRLAMLLERKGWSLPPRFDAYVDDLRKKSSSLVRYEQLAFQKLVKLQRG